MNINQYCRQYRESKGVTLKSLIGGDRVKTLSAFEHSRSTNIEHVYLYINLSKEMGDIKNFLLGLEVVKNG